MPPNSYVKSILLCLILRGATVYNPLCLLLCSSLPWAITNEQKWHCLDIPFICVNQSVCVCVYLDSQDSSNIYIFFPLHACMYICIHSVHAFMCLCIRRTAGAPCTICLHSCIHTQWMWLYVISAECKSPGLKHIKPLSKSNWTASVLLSSGYKYLVCSINTAAF